jgi:hypothetical protein
MQKLLATGRPTCSRASSPTAPAQVLRLSGRGTDGKVGFEFEKKVASKEARGQEEGRSRMNEGADAGMTCRAVPQSAGLPRFHVELT